MALGRLRKCGCDEWLLIANYKNCVKIRLKKGGKKPIVDKKLM